MRAVVQRVSRASVNVAADTVGSIGAGLVVLVAFRIGDGEETLEWMRRKLLGLRVFPDDDGKMNKDVVAVGGELLIVSQFTLYSDTTKGHRPSYIQAAPPADAERLYDEFVDLMKNSPVRVQTGRFGAMMDVELVNHGPVTLIVDR
ncbi:MAG: D-aminoacyl-tRNA deacylase [Gemmatimonadales bacterium]